MNVLDLFSGIGGFSLGLERAGMRTVAFCERDEFCRAVLHKHWPDVPCFDDIRAIDAGGLDRLGRIDLVCGGFPCQPFSVAGKQAAHADDRYLWPEMRRVITFARPAWVIGENVAGIIALALDDVLSDLEGIGYAARSFVIPACAVDAPHRRDRVWIIASANPNVSRLERRKLGELQERKAERSTRESCPPTANSASQRSLSTTYARIYRGEEGERPWNGESERPYRWKPEPNVGRVAHGVPRRVDRLRALGNAVVPQVVEEIGRAIMTCAHTSGGDPNA